jgi:hypothetical protein
MQWDGLSTALFLRGQNLGIRGLGTGGWVVPIPVGCQEFGGASAYQTWRSHCGYAEACLRPDRISGVDAKQCHGVRASATARSGLRRRPPSADNGVRMIWKLRGTRPPTRGGIPACPTFWSGNHLHTSRARPLTGARSRPAEKSDDHVFITYRSPQDFSLKVPASWTRTETPSNVVFEDQHHGIEVSIVDVTATALAGRGRPVRFATSPRAVPIRCVGVRSCPRDARSKSGSHQSGAV